MSNSNILITIILSESTGSFFKLQKTNEEFIEYSGSSFTLKPIVKPNLKKDNKFLSFFKSKKNLEDDNEVMENTLYFAKDYDSESKLSVKSMASIDSSDEVLSKEASFEKISVFTRPLIILKVKAHEENIVVKNNTIIIKLMDDQIDLIDSELICRICHGGESFGDLLSPCRCRGTIALAHEECLVRWLKESSKSFCELCQHRFQIIRKQKFGKLRSIPVYLSDSNDNIKEILLDTLAFAIYTPSTIVTTYMLMIICENMAKTHFHNSRAISANVVTFCAIFGIAAIDFTYSTWLICTLQKHVSAWHFWYQSQSYLKIILPIWRRTPYKKLNKLNFEKESMVEIKY